MRPTTAVIFAAGFGTRLLPITSAVQKELLPIGTRPIIDFVVADCVAAGITRIIFIVRPGQRGLRDYYEGNEALERQLTRFNKVEALEQLQRIHHQAKFEFVEQPESSRYGTAIPMQAALPHLDTNETVLVCGGDDMVWHADGTSEMTRFITAFERSHARGALMGLYLPPEQLGDYGVLETSPNGGEERLIAIHEKPQHITKPGYANISKYILDVDTWKYAQDIQPRSNGESYLTDVLTRAAEQQNILVHKVTGTYLDTGTPKRWLEANNVVLKGQL